MPTYLVNAAYVLMLCAFVARDILWLRLFLAGAQSLLVTFAWLAGLPAIAGWNALFVAINTFMAARILRERRRVALPPSLRRLHERHFAALSPPEFLRWWGLGRRERLENAALTRAGEHPDWLYFLLDGRVRVSRDSEPVVELPDGYFVGEMSLLTGQPANADVHALGPVDVVRWPRRELHALRDHSPVLWTKIQSVIGHDLVEKIRIWELRSGHA
jgi:hypothetical protein